MVDRHTFSASFGVGDDGDSESRRERSGGHTLVSLASSHLLTAGHRPSPTPGSTLWLVSHCHLAPSAGGRSRRRGCGGGGSSLALSEIQHQSCLLQTTATAVVLELGRVQALGSQLILSRQSITRVFRISILHSLTRL